MRETPYLEQGLAAEVHYQEPLGSVPTTASGLLEHRPGQQHGVRLHLTLLLLHIKDPEDPAQHRPQAPLVPNTPFLNTVFWDTPQDARESGGRS